MHNRGYTKALIVLCVGLLIGVTAYAVLSGDAPGAPQHQEQEEQENENMSTIEISMPTQMCDEIKEIADYYGMSFEDVVMLLLNPQIESELTTIEFAKAWDRKVQEDEQ